MMIARQDGLLRYVEQHLLEPVRTGSYDMSSSTCWSPS
jgi:hypothetical protein